MKKWFKKNQKSKLSENHLRLLNEHIRILHNPKIYKPHFNIPPLRKGALCNCTRVMSYHQGKFECICGVKSKEPLYQGLNDYRLLISEWITNKEFREFFNIDREDVVNKLLTRMNLYYVGSTKSRKYLIPEVIWIRS
ncbi:hypothetical protein UACE39S_04069 [Ureibacillus acetophenoni]